MQEPKFDFPLVSKELLDRLDKLYPERCPDPEWAAREVWMRAGERRVVRKLKQAYEIQNRRDDIVQQ